MLFWHFVVGIRVHIFKLSSLHVLLMFCLVNLFGMLEQSALKPTIHEATFVTGGMATLLLVRAAHELSNATFYKLLENRQPVYFQATCRMYHVIFPCAACTNNNVAVWPATKVASCMVSFSF